MVYGNNSSFVFSQMQLMAPCSYRDSSRAGEARETRLNWVSVPSAYVHTLCMLLWRNGRC